MSIGARIAPLPDIDADTDEARLVAKIVEMWTLEGALPPRMA
jgi:hypothetical protein